MEAAATDFTPHSAEQELSDEPGPTSVRRVPWTLLACVSKTVLGTVASLHSNRSVPVHRAGSPLPSPLSTQ